MSSLYDSAHFTGSHHNCHSTAATVKADISERPSHMRAIKSLIDEKKKLSIIYFTITIFKTLSDDKPWAE